MSSGPAPAPPTAAGGIMQQVEALEHAKRRAAASFTRMVAHPSAQDTAQTTRDEQDVLGARVAVLNALLRQDPAKSTPLCLEATGRKGPRVCVTYDRLRCEGELELGPMQSTMAWAVRDAEDPLLQLMSAPDDQPPAGVVRGLLDLVRKSAPKKDVLQGLHAALALPAPERLVLKSLRGVNAPEHGGHARVFEGLGEGAGPVPPLYRVISGALDLDVLEGWQNPSTNAAIRLSILDAAHQAAREAQRTKAPQWSNVAYLQVRVFHGEECHRLSLTPFWDSESCTVSHLQFKQSVFDDSGPERGLLNLGPDPASIHPIPLGTILPLEAYVCLGAHRKSRLSEAQLNYVHAQGLLAHGFDTGLLPDATQLFPAQPGRMLAAKATRVSGDKLDVMASSYHVADQVYTTISVVQYPPFGTQFEKRGDAWRKLSPPETTTRFKTCAEIKQGVKPRTGIKQHSKALADLAASDDDDDEMQVDHSDPNAHRYYDDDDDEDDVVVTNVPVSRNDIHRDPLRPGETPAYRQVREYLPKFYMDIDGKAHTRARKNNWKIDLRDGEHYFVDGLSANPHDIQPRNISKRLIWFEMDNGSRYKQAATLFHDTKNYIKQQQIPWNNLECFYWNLENNLNTGIDGLTAGQIWYNRWKPLIELHAWWSIRDRIDGRNVAHFWYVQDDAIWDDIFKERSERDGFDWAAAYKTHQHNYMESMKRNHMLKKGLRSRNRQNLAIPLLTNPNELPLPQTRLSARSAGKDPVVGQLQSRIAALETRLDRARQDENTQFLLSKVLERLETPEEV